MRELVEMHYLLPDPVIMRLTLDAMRQASGLPRSAEPQPRATA